MHHIRQATNLEEFVFQMDQSDDKAIAALGVLRYLRQNQPDGAAGSTLEAAVGGRVLDLRLPNGNGREFKLYDWSEYNGPAHIRLAFDGDRGQIAGLVAEQPVGTRLGIVFDQPMPQGFFDQLRESFGAELLASIDIEYLFTP